MIERVSHSAIKDYQNCPLLFYYRKVLKLDLPDKGIHLHFGSAIHKALELYQTEKSDPVKIFQGEFTKDVLSKEEQEKHPELYDKGTELMEYYLSKEQILREDYGIKIVRTERKIIKEKVIDPATKVKMLFKEITGIIDFETEDDRLGDYKTAGKPYKQQDVDESLQPTMYYLLYFLEHGKLPASFVYIILLKKRKREPIQILETTRTMEDITNLINLINDIHRKVELKLYERGHGDDAWCDCFKYDNLLKI